MNAKNDMNVREDSLRTGRSRLGRWGFVIAAIGGLALSFPIWGWVLWIPRLKWAEHHNRMELGRRRDRYEAIVGRISSLSLPGRPPTYFEISPGRDPESLKEIDQKNDSLRYDLYKEGRLVHAWRDRGYFIVEFITQDFGHFGTYSLVYSEPPLPPGYTTRPYVTVTQLEAHWQAVSGGH